MARLEAVLTYSADQFGRDGVAVVVGKTADAEVVKILREQLSRDLAAEAEMWQGVDPALGELVAAEADRLDRVLGFLLPRGVAPSLTLAPRRKK